MTFDLEPLKARMKAHLNSDWWNRARTTGLTSVRTTFAGAAMVPIVVEVLRNPAEFGPLLKALTAGTFGSLISAQLERWRGENKTPTELELATWIAAQADRDADVKKGVDDLLDALGAAGIASGSLSPAHVIELANAMRDDLPRFTNTLTGDGNVIAQAVEGSVVISGNPVFNAPVSIQLGMAGSGPKPKPSKQAKAKRPQSYLDWVKSQCA